MSEIPDDIILTGALTWIEALADGTPDGGVIIARALLAERLSATERAAKIAEAQIAEPGLSDNPAYIRYEPSHNMAKKIAAAIRSQP